MEHKLRVLFDAGGLWQFIPQRFKAIMSQQFSCNFLDREHPRDHIRKGLGKWADVIFVDWGLEWAKFYLENFGDKRIIVRTHRGDVWHENSPFYYWENASAVLFMSNHYRNLFLENCAANVLDDMQERCITVPRLVDEQHWRFLSDSTSQRIYGRRLGMLGRCTPRKRVVEFMRLFNESLAAEHPEPNRWTEADLLTPNFSLSLLGFEEEDRLHFPDYIAELESLVRSSDRIRVLGHIDGDAVVKWFADVDFIVSYSEDESWHAAITEGMLCGCVPVISNWPGAEEMHPAECIVRDDAELVDFLKKHSPPLRYEDGHGWLPKVQNGRIWRSERARQWCLERYRLEAVTDLYAAIIRGDEVPLDLNPQEIIPFRKKGEG